MDDKDIPADATTGAPILNITPPEPADMPDVGKPPHMDGTEDADLLRDTAVQGAPEDE